MSVTADILSSDVGSASTNLETEVNKLELPDGVSVQFGGVTEQINETFGQLGLAMLAAIAIVYFVLVVTFGGDSLHSPSCSRCRSLSSALS